MAVSRERGQDLAEACGRSRLCACVVKVSACREDGGRAEAYTGMVARINASSECWKAQMEDYLGQKWDDRWWVKEPL